MSQTARLLRVVSCACLVTAAACSFDNTSPGTHANVSARTALSLGTNFSCGVTTTGSAYCWGDNSLGQGGNGLIVPSTFPTAIAAAGPFLAVSASESSACALDSSGSVSCWGALPDGDATQSTRALPVKLASPVKFRSISVGDAFACGLDADGLAYCWGVNEAGQLGVGDTTARSAPMAVSGGIRFTQISAGFAHTCGATAGGTVYCWGDNGDGQVGDTTRARTVMQPHAVPTTLAMKSVSAGSVYTCAVAIDGTGYCWGFNTGGQLGDGTTQSHRLPHAVGGGLKFASISAERGNSELEHTCGVTTAGVAYCWGANSAGEVGGPASDACIGFGAAAVCNLLPLAVRSLKTVVAIDAGYAHSCAITSAGAMMCWGDNSAGELGDGTHAQQAVPVTVLGGLHFH